MVSAVRRRIGIIKKGSGSIGVVAGDTTLPVVTGSQVFNYVENQAAGYSVGTVLATDNVGVTGYRFSATTTGTSADGFFTISSAGLLQMTVAGAASTMNDFDDVGGGSANSAVYGIQARDAAGNWSLAVNVTINVLDVDDVAPVVTGAQSFSYAENQAAGFTVGTVLATDNVAVTGYRFTATTSATSSDGYYSISNAGVVTLTSAGAAVGSPANDFETNPNSFTHGVQARDAAGNWSASVNVNFIVTDADEPLMLVGMNVGPTVDYSANIVFANLLRSMRPWKRVDDGSDLYWASQNQGVVTGATGTHRFYSVVITPEAGLPSQTLRFKNPNGNNIAFWSSASDPGSGNFHTDLTRDVPYTAGSYIYIQAMGNVSGTMALLLDGHETSYAGGNEFASDFLAFHTGLGTRVLRFMDGSATNTTLDQTWSDRTVTGKINFQGSGGIQIPYEVQADLCNRLNADMWVNVPPRASTSTYTPSLASLLFSTLNSTRKVYPERGNEIWNLFGSFKKGTEWIRRWGHTRFTFTAAGTTFTKTAHGYSNDQRFQSFAGVSVPQVGVDSETQVATANWATATSYTAGQYIRGDFTQDGVQYICLANHTSGATFAGDLAGGKWQRIEWYLLTSGDKLYVKVLTANTFELWTGAGGTGVKAAAPTIVTSLIGILSDEFGVIADEAGALNTQYATLALADWTAFDTAFGGTSRVKATLGSQAASAGTWTAGRLAVSGVATRCNHLHIAPYHNGVVWGGKVVPAAGKITPYFWTSNDGATGHCTIYTAGSTPTLTQRKAGTGTGFQTRLTPMTVNSSQRNWTQAADVTIADGTYKVYMDFVDAEGFTWTVTNTVVVGSGQPVVDFIDTDANQQLRDLWNIDSGAGDISFIQAHQALIAASSNPAITVVNYEGGSHQDYYPPAGSGVDTWYRAHRQSATYGETLRHYYNIMAACGVKLHCHYMDVSGQAEGLDDTPWRIANTYADTTDPRYVAVAAFAGSVAQRTLVDFGTVTGTSFATAPTYPAVVATFSDATLTYSVMQKGTLDDGIYSITGNVLSITGSGSINFAAPATQSVWIRATDGYTDAYFQVQFLTGDAWYSSAYKAAWTAIDDTTPAAMNLVSGASFAVTGSAATVVSDGWDLAGVAEYNGSHSQGTLAISVNPLFLFVGRPDGDTSGFQNVCQFGTGPSVQWYTSTSSQVVITSSLFTDIAIPGLANTNAVFWVTFDSASSKFYYGVNQTVKNPSGTAFTPPGTPFSQFVQVGQGSCSWVVRALESAPTADLTAALALVQKAQTKHSIP